MTTSDVQLFVSTDGHARLEVALDNDTVWLSQAQMAELFGSSPENILLHLKNIYREKELAEKPTTKDFLVVRKEGQRQVRRRIKRYNPDGAH